MNIRMAMLVLALLALRAPCADDDYPLFAFDGFGTLGVAHSTEEYADFRASLAQPDGAGYSHEWSPDLDSRLGLQLSARFSERLSGIVQVISEHNADGSYDPKVEWANLKYQFTPRLSVRAGRIVLPTFLVSDHRRVAYANPWVRPPAEVYGLVGITSSDGIDVSYRIDAPAATTTLLAFHGNRDFEVPFGDAWRAEDIFGLVASVEFGPALLRAGYQSGSIRSPLVSDFFDRYRVFGPDGSRIADTYDIRDKDIDTWTFGGRYEPDAGFVMGEWVRSESDSFLGRNTGWYLSAGRRFDSLTPYVTYARRTKASINESGLKVSEYPPEMQPDALFLNFVLELLVNANSYETAGIGARWDFRPGVSLKLQFDHVRLDEGSYGDLFVRDPAFEPGGSLNVISANIDFVF